MLSVEQAQDTVLSAARPLSVEPCSLSHSLGHMLAEDVESDIDMPPFDKSLVDGFAVRSDDLPQGQGQLSVVGEIVAGSPAWADDRSLGAGQAVRIADSRGLPAPLQAQN